MASIQLRPPEPFNLKTPDEWPRWRRRFEQFRVASGLGDASAEKQVSTLLYCLGEESESVLSSTNATEDDRKDYAIVLQKFDSFFQVRRNVIFERARFNRRNQLPAETSEQYIMALYSLAANCNYGALEGEMIRDRLVVGIRDASLSERLQLDADLTLEKAKKSIRQREAVHEQQGILSGAEASGPSVDAIRPSPDRAETRPKRPKRPKRSTRPKRATRSRPAAPSGHSEPLEDEDSKAVLTLWKGATHARQMPGQGRDLSQVPKDRPLRLAMPVEEHLARRNWSRHRIPRRHKLNIGRDGLVR